MADEAVPIAYTALQPGTLVLAADGGQIGAVRSVLADEEVDVFDGIVISTEAGARFVDAPYVGRIFTTLVETSLTAEQVATLPEPDNAQFQRIKPGDRVGRSLLSRLFGNKPGT